MELGFELYSLSSGSMPLPIRVYCNLFNKLNDYRTRVYERDLDTMDNTQED